LHAASIGSPSAGHVSTLGDALAFAIGPLADPGC
jgi:hypothetical protein